MKTVQLHIIAVFAYFIYQAKFITDLGNEWELTAFKSGGNGGRDRIRSSNDIY